MKKLFLVGLMMLTGSAWAEWLRYEENKKNIFYYDPATIRKDGNMRRVWVLMDIRKRNDNGAMSTRMRYEYDCKQERYRFLGMSSHSEPMAGGTLLETYGEDNNWMAIAPDTIDETMLEIVCAK